MRFLALLGLGVLAAAVAVGLNLVLFLQQTGITQAVLNTATQDLQWATHLGQ